MKPFKIDLKVNVTKIEDIEKVILKLNEIESKYRFIELHIEMNYSE